MLKHVASVFFLFVLAWPVFAVDPSLSSDLAMEIVAADVVDASVKPVPVPVADVAVQAPFSLSVPSGNSSSLSSSEIWIVANSHRRFNFGTRQWEVFSMPPNVVSLWKARRL